MSVGAVHAFRKNIGYVGAHASLLVSGIGLLFLQQYLWILNLARQGYGPYASSSSITGISALVIIADLIILRWAMKGSRGDKYVSLAWPALFFTVALFIIVANNL